MRTTALQLAHLTRLASSIGGTREGVVMNISFRPPEWWWQSRRLRARQLETERQRLLRTFQAAFPELSEREARTCAEETRRAMHRPDSTMGGGRGRE